MDEADFFRELLFEVLALAARLDFGVWPDFLRPGLLEERLVVAREDPMTTLYPRGPTSRGTETRTD